MRIVGFGQDGDLNLTNVIIEDDGREYWFENPRWINVEERLPENEQMVIGYTPCDGYMFVGYYREEQNWKQWYIVTAMRSTKYVTKKVTHWMHLPEPPKEAP